MRKLRVEQMCLAPTCQRTEQKIIAFILSLSVCCVIFLSIQRSFSGLQTLCHFVHTNIYSKMIDFIRCVTGIIKTKKIERKYWKHHVHWTRTLHSGVQLVTIYTYVFMCVCVSMSNYRSFAICVDIFEVTAFKKDGLQRYKSRTIATKRYRTIRQLQMASLAHSDTHTYICLCVMWKCHNWNK